RQVRCDHEELVGEALVAWPGETVEPRPRNEHRHHERLATAGGELDCEPLVHLTRGGDAHADLEIGWRLGQEGDRLDSFLLAEERPRVRSAALLVEPVVKQVSRNL